MSNNIQHEALYGLGDHCFKNVQIKRIITSQGGPA